jgi:hypothetical protein
MGWIRRLRKVIAACFAAIGGVVRRERPPVDGVISG